MTEQMTIEHPISSYQDMPLTATIQSNLTTVADLDAEIELKTRLLDVAKARIALDVLGQTNEAGKPFYSNEESRKAAITIAVAECPETARYETDLTELRRERAARLAIVEATKYAVRLDIATLDAAASPFGRV